VRAPWPEPEIERVPPNQFRGDLRDPVGAGTLRLSDLRSQQAGALIDRSWARVRGNAAGMREASVRFRDLVAAARGIRVGDGRVDGFWRTRRVARTGRPVREYVRPYSRDIA
jgi:hypothetical protein